MAPQSERKKLLKDLDDTLFQLVIQKSTEPLRKKIAEIQSIKALLLSTRYMTTRNTIPKCPSHRDQILTLPNTQFQLIARMKKESFRSLEQLLRSNPSFKNNSPNEQRPVWVQLLVALERLACDGNGVSVGRVALTYGVSVSFYQKGLQQGWICCSVY